MSGNDILTRLHFFQRVKMCIISTDYMIINVYPFASMYSHQIFVVELVLMKEIALYF